MLDIFNDLRLFECIMLSRTGVSDKTEVVYEEPDLKLFWAKKDMEPEKCPALWRKKKRLIKY